VDTTCHSFCSCCRPDFIVIKKDSVHNVCQQPSNCSSLDDALEAFWDCTCAMCMFRIIKGTAHLLSMDLGKDCLMCRAGGLGGVHGRVALQIEQLAAVPSDGVSSCNSCYSISPCGGECCKRLHRYVNISVEQRELYIYAFRPTCTQKPLLLPHTLQ